MRNVWEFTKTFVIVGVTAYLILVITNSLVGR